jgi:hypothetical protein
MEDEVMMTLAEERITYQTRTNGKLESETLLCFLHEAIENLGTQSFS